MMVIPVLSTVYTVVDTLTSLEKREGRMMDGYPLPLVG